MVRTRFAPSPTGYLHLGGVRTALFNWLFARQHGGQFLLRIDDTDAQRNVQEALAPILHGFRWLGIDWDEGPDVGGPHAPYFQSQRGPRYAAAVRTLLDRGAAYYDYARPEEMQAEREAAEREKRPFVYSRSWAGDTPETRAALEAEGRQPVVRLKMPRAGTLTLNDMVRGEVCFEWAREQDHVVQRADGSCLYHLATVIDDHDFGITHVIRAEEHLSNTPRQVFIAEQLGYQLPAYAHLPYVAEPGSRNKLSKRKLDKYLQHRDFARLAQLGREIADRLGRQTIPETFNPVVVDFYEQIGFLPEALVNYLLLLGWSLDDKTEDFSRAEMIRHFSLERVNKAPASFDPQKLLAFQARAMQRLTLAEKRALVQPYLERAGWVDARQGSRDGWIEQLLQAAGDRITVAGDILRFEEFFLGDNRLVYDEQALEKRLRKPGAVELLRAFRGQLADVEPFDAETTEKTLRSFVQAQDIKIGDMIHVLRVAVTGKAEGLGLFDGLALLGKPRVLARIDRALEIA